VAGNPSEALIDELPLGVLLVQPGGAISLVNAAALDLLGLPRRVVVRARLRELLPQAAELTGPGAAAVRVRLDDRQLLAEARPFEGGEGELLVTLRDVTGQVALERVKSAFVSDLLHKIRTPLTTIKSGLSAIASSRVNPDAVDVDALLGMSRAETDRLVLVLDDIRDLFLVDTGLLVDELDPATVEVGELLEEIRKAREGEASEAGVDLAVGANGQQHRVWVDPRYLRRALLKVVENSLRYTPAGGRVTLSAENRGDRVEIVLADDGPGMSEEEEMRAFDRFFRGSSAHTHVPDGVGLGLTLARDLVRLMGGEVKLETGPGLGTRVSFLLPGPPEAE
jgi:signal transduction histidine kinase